MNPLSRFVLSASSHVALFMLTIASLLASVSAHAAVTAYLSAGTTCSGGNNVTYVPGGANVQISICLTTSVENACGSTVRLQSANAGENDRFRLVTQTVGNDFTGSLTFPAGTAIANPPTGTPISIETALGMGLAPATGRLLVTLDVAPQGTATNASYVLSLSPISMVAIGNGTGTCSFVAPTDALITGSFTLVKQ